MTALTSETLSKISRINEVTVGPGGDGGTSRGPLIISPFFSTAIELRTKVDKSVYELCDASVLRCSSKSSIWSPAIHVEAATATDRDAFSRTSK